MKKKYIISILQKKKINSQKIYWIGISNFDKINNYKSNILAKNFINNFNYSSLKFLPPIIQIGDINNLNNIEFIEKNESLIMFIYINNTLFLFKQYKQLQLTKNKFKIFYFYIKIYKLLNKQIEKNTVAN